jgi:hypothetical protein
MKIIYYIPFILFTAICLILFSNKSYSIDVVTTTSTESGITIGQLQHFDIETLRFVRFYPDEYSSTLQYIPYERSEFRFYGQPGSVSLRAFEVSGDLSSYDLMMSTQINLNPTIKQVFRNWFINFPPEPYPAEEEEEEEENNNDDPVFNDVDREALELTILTISMTAFSIFGFTTGMTFRFDS